MDYAEPLIKAKQALKDYEQAVLHGEWERAFEIANEAYKLTFRLELFARDKCDSQP